MLVLILGILILALVSCGQTVKNKTGQSQRAMKKESNLESKYGGVFKERLLGDPSSLDPAHITDSTSYKLAINIYNGLVKFDEELNIVPDIAKSWKISEDGLTWTFNLKKGVKFHNGDKVTAEDFVFSFTRIVDPETKSERQWLFNNIKGVDEFQAGKVNKVAGLKAVGEYTLEITLEKPFTPFLSVLAMVNAAVVSEQAIKKYGPNYGQHPVGTGPFKFKEWQHGNKIILTTNEKYFTGRPYLNKVVYRIIADQSLALAEYEQGNIYSLEGNFLPGQRKRILNSKQFAGEVRKNPVLGTYYFGFNTTKEPFDNSKVRKALNYAVNREAIAKVLKGGVVKPAHSILPSAMPGHNEDLKGYPYNLKKAKKLLAEAGYPDGLPGEYELSYNAGRLHQSIAEAIQSEFKKIGVDVKLFSLEWGSYLEKIANGNTEIFRFSWFADYPDPDNFLYVLFHSQNTGAGGNNTFYRNLKFDKLIEKARKMEPGRKRIQTYQKAEEMVMDDAPWIPIYYYTRISLIKPFVNGYRISAIRPLALTKVWLDKSVK